MTSLVSQSKADFLLWKDNSPAFEEKVNLLNDSLGLKGHSSLVSSVPPTYFAGLFEQGKRKSLIVGINPGYGEKNIQFESTLRNSDWEAYLDFHSNFFSYYGRSGNSINYYSYLSGVLVKDKEELIGELGRFGYCQNNLVNVDLLPYHSKGFNRGALSSTIKADLVNRFNNTILTLIKESSGLIERVIIHDKHLTEIIKELYKVDDSSLVFTGNQNKTVHRFFIERVPVYLFSRFIPNGGFSRDAVQEALSK